MTTERIQLGDKVRDTMTGFEGIAVTIADYLNGCRRIAVQPTKLKDGKVPDDVYFDEQQLERLGARWMPPAQPKLAARTGGPRPAPRRASDPR